MGNKRRNEQAPWSEAIRRNPAGLDGVIRQRLEKQGFVTYQEVQEGACAKHGTVKNLFERLYRTGKADWTDDGIKKAEA
jgi:hypothetical protein